MSDAILYGIDILQTRTRHFGANKGKKHMIGVHISIIYCCLLFGRSENILSVFDTDLSVFRFRVCSLAVRHSSRP